MRTPEMVAVSQRVSAIPTKRVALPETWFLERDEVHELLEKIPDGRLATRDHAMLLFLYNTGARAQEVTDLRVENIDFGPPARVRLLGKGGKWRSCPHWAETAEEVAELLQARRTDVGPDSAVFVSTRGQPLTRFGIYKVVRRHSRWIESQPKARSRRVSPDVFRHTAAVYLLESGVEIILVSLGLSYF